MKRAACFFLIVGCQTPGTLGSDMPPDPNAVPEDEMILQLEATPDESATIHRVLAEVPALPQESWILVFDRSSRIGHLLQNDGTYVIEIGDAPPRAMPILSRHQPASTTLSTDAHERIVRSLADVQFGALEAHLPDATLDLGDEQPMTDPRPWAFRVRDESSGRVHTVEVRADATVAASFGPLAPLWKTLDDEVFGRWLVGAVERQR